MLAASCVVCLALTCSLLPAAGLLHTLPCSPGQDKKRAGVYEAPCYRVKARKGLNFITTFSLRTEDDRAKWVLRGVALLCSID